MPKPLRKIAVSLFLFLCSYTFIFNIDVSAISFSGNYMNIDLGKKVFLKPSGCSSNISWTTNNAAIATVSSEGIVSTVGQGKAVITARDMNNGSGADFVVEVGPKAPVRFAYVTPNTCNPGTEASVYATTDCHIEAVRFDIEHNGRKFSVPATERFVEGNSHVWRGKFRMSSEGTYNVKVYSRVSGKWRTCSDGTAKALAKRMAGKSDCAYGERRISDEGLNFIASCEGFASEVYKDSLARGILTLGYGHVVQPYTPFFTGFSQREGMAMLIKTIDRKNFENDVNKFLLQNNVMFSQQQFDSLVSFTYNLGSSWTRNNCEFSNVLLNSGTGPSQCMGVVHSGNGINVRNGPGTNHKIITAIGNNAAVQVLDRNKVNGNWYRVKTNNGLIGYCFSDYLSLSEIRSGSRNLNNINKEEFVSNMAIYHHAGGRCIKGLLTRRFWEIDMFLYGEYGINGRFNSRYPNRHGHMIPRCMAGRY